MEIRQGTAGLAKYTLVQEAGASLRIDTVNGCIVVARQATRTMPGCATSTTRRMEHVRFRHGGNRDAILRGLDSYLLVHRTEGQGAACVRCVNMTVYYQRALAAAPAIAILASRMTSEAPAGGPAIASLFSRGLPVRYR